MAIPSPKIDRRSYQDLVQQTQNLAETYTESKWKSPPPGESDTGLAMIRIFSRMASLVSDRLNRVLDRNLLAFINLIGTQLVPPQPAQVPLTFNLAEGSPVDVLVPAHTQVAAPPSEGEKEEVIFETEQELLVTDTQLQALFVSEDRDYYSNWSDRIAPEIANQNEAFFAFKGDHPVAHDLYLYCEEIFNLPELATITITIDTNNNNSDIKLKELLNCWFYWNEVVWEPFAQVHTQELESQVIIRLDQLPKLLPIEINGIKAKWLRASLTPQQRENLPEIIQIQVSASLEQVHVPKTCLFNTITLDLSKDFYPFGETPLSNNTFAIELDRKLIKPGGIVEIRVNLNHKPSHIPDLDLIWEIGNGLQWQPIQVVPNEENVFWSHDLSSLKFLELSTSATLQFPEFLPGYTKANESEENSYWIRARITRGLYGTRGRERKYVIYNDVTLVSQAINSGQREIVVDSVDELEIDDIIRIQSSVGQPRQEEAKVIDKSAAQKKLILECETRNAYEAGTRILSKFTIAENIPDTFAPPLIQSLTLTYKFTLKRSACYYAYNDFNYCQGSPLSIRLSQAAESRNFIVHLDDVSQLTIGEFLKFDDAHPETRQVELIDQERSLVIFTKLLEHAHPRGGRVVRSFHPLTPSINRDSALYLGFNKPFSNRPNTLYLPVESPDPQEVAPGVYYGDRDSNLQRVAWEYASPNGWQPLVVHDETQALKKSGLIQFIGPTDFIPSPYFGQSLYWLRVRKKPNAWDKIPFSLIYFFKWAVAFRQVNLYGLMRDLMNKVSRYANFPVQPRVRSVLTNTIWASQTVTLENEVLGSSNSELNQLFSTTHSPILLNQQLEVQEGRMPSVAESSVERQFGSGAISPVVDEVGRVEAVWVQWQEMPDFYSSGPNDRHYVVDHQAGKIQFGDGQAGIIPPRGRNNIRLVRYQTGGGSRGNRAAQTIIELKTTIPYIDSTINWEAARGGNEPESLDRLKERAPQRLRHGDRAVTAQDFEDLTYEASIEVARVKVITPGMMDPDFNPLLETLWLEPEGLESSADQPIASHEIRVFNHDIRPGRVQVIVVPQSYSHQPTPSLSLLNRVETFLRSRCVPTMKLHLTGPKWEEIRVITEIVPISVTSADAIRLAVEQRIQSFLHPLTGGDQGLGWSFGRKPHRSDLYAILEAVPGVKYVRTLDIQPANVAINQQTLIYSGRHIVMLKLQGDSD